MEPISIPQIIASLPGAYVPRDLATVNDAIVRVARLEGANPIVTSVFLCVRQSPSASREGWAPG